MPNIIMLNIGKLGSFMPNYLPPTHEELKKGRKPRSSQSYRGFRRNFNARWMRKEAKLDRKMDDQSFVTLHTMQSHRREFPELWDARR